MTAVDAPASRIGSYGTVLERMLRALPPADAGALGRLTTRASDDPAIALLDAAAVVVDVLAFYQERFAAEGYLRTAEERRSVLELARLIGYELSPGVAANAFLAFDVEDRAPSGARGGVPPLPRPGPATVPAVTAVQSVPVAAGELPQTFETAAELVVRPEWNRLRPRLARPARLDPRTTRLELAGTATGVEPGDLLLYALPVPGSAAPATSVVRVTGVAADEAAGRTAVDVADVPEPDGDWPKHEHEELERQARERREDDEEDAARRKGDVDMEAEVPLNDVTVKEHIRERTWGERELRVFLSVNRWPRDDLADHIRRRPPGAAPPAEGLFRFRARAGFFGAAAPRHDALPLPVPPRQNAEDPWPYDWDAGEGWPIWTDSVTGERYADAQAFLDRPVPEVVSGDWMVIEQAGRARPFSVAAATEEALAGFGLSGRATGVVLANADGTPAVPEKAEKPKPKAKPEKTEPKPDHVAAAPHVRRATAHAAAAPLTLADERIDAPLAAGEQRIELDTLVPGLDAGRQLALTGERHDLAGAEGREVHRIAEVQHVGGFTRLTLAGGLAHDYVRASVVLNANVAPAMHGETVPSEPLGSGGAGPNQRFSLRKPPLTYVSSAAAGGAESTLEIRVDGVLWKPVRSLLDAGPDDEVYAVRLQDDGSAELTLGDGAHGARPPTGIENIVAHYRSGIGAPGLVGADRITLLLQRPPGVRTVTNPLPAEGAAEPETRDAARRNAPLSVLATDSIVSLRDFEDFARAFAGIEKAQAVAVWRGELTYVHLTVAGEQGAVVEPGSATYEHLADAIRAACDPVQPFRVDAYRPVYFNVEASVLVDPRRERDAVLSAATGAVADAFVFVRRDFGRPVEPAAVVAVLQGVEGVEAVHLTGLYRVLAGAPEHGAAPAPLHAEPATWVGDQPRGAQLLLVNPAGIKLTEAER